LRRGEEGSLGGMLLVIMWVRGGIEVLLLLEREV
jgi:hypothetical protein